jgi:hypothetical protein
MSKIFWDDLVNLKKINKVIKESVSNEDERQELWKIVDEIVHHKVMGCILDNLPISHHADFLEKFHNAPYDSGLHSFLNIKSGKDFKKIISSEMEKLEDEIIDLVRYGQ